MQHARTRSSFMAAGALSASILGVWSSSLFASDPLAMIPADAPMVVGFRDLDSSARKLNDFLRTVDTGFAGVDLDEVQRGFNLADGVVDTSAPVFLIMTRPQFEERAFVLAFTPRDESAFSEQVSGPEGTIARCEGPEGPHYMMMREGVAFVGLRRKAVRPLRRVSPEEALSLALDGQQKALFATSDVFIHISLPKWRDRIRPFFFVARRMILLGAHAGQKQQMSEASIAIVEWLADGVEATLDQMETMTLALGFDGDVFRLAHHHAFTPGRSVANYLGQVKRRGRDLWGGLPDRPFFIVGAFDWQTSGDTSVASRFNRYVFGAKSLGRRFSEARRQRLLDTTVACYDQMWGSSFMATSAEGTLHPLWVLGGYAMEDADTGIGQLLYLQENAGEVMTTFVGGEYSGRFSRLRTGGGREFFEMRFDLERMDPLIRQQTVSLYGDDVRIREVVAGKHDIAYSMAGPSVDVFDLVEVRNSGRSVSKNPLVRQVLGRLPDGPHGVVIADMGRLLAAIPSWMEAGRAVASPHAPRADRNDVRYSNPPGPMLGWACEARENSFSGWLVIDAKGVVRVFKLLREMAEGFHSAVNASPGSGAPVPREPSR
ncbi:MAG: hypothetical protein JXQ75_12455 [Phycisphaerae bacterium]|nr:hypothetical protein [Phycisphaerae bacterium]